ncbi:TetR/AcrR family transcriptional regulator [Vibrio zhugei]|uniref:TetR/AcrR family transcriptional regulator n=1 Tax=Vibrio zhugei TaxID=2479546 RepID=A0ABV7CE05_9VIBR|nr:TetR/AcrR family transcriptional regulator [Vibrio zhugei]
MPRSNNLTSIERKKRTVKTVIELCQEIEPASITTAIIAKRMGVTQGALFRHFPSKDAIWEEVTLWVSQQVLALLDQKLTGAAQPLTNLESMYLAHIKFISQYPGIPRLIFSQLHKLQTSPAQKTIGSLMETYQERVKQQILRGIKLGVIEPNVNINSAASMFLGTIQGTVVKSFIQTEDALSAKSAKSMFEIYRRGIELNSHNEA